MASARYIITRALRRIRVVGVTDSPPAEIASHALDSFNDLLTAYEADNLSTETVVITGNVQSGSRKVSDLNNAANLKNTDALVVGMQVDGDGVSSTVHEIVSQGEINLANAATASGTGITLTFSSLPMDDSLTQALIDVLAERIAPDFGRPITPEIRAAAMRGQAQIDGVFFRVPTKNGVDSALSRISRGIYDEFVQDG